MGREAECVEGNPVTAWRGEVTGGRPGAPGRLRLGAQDVALKMGIEALGRMGSDGAASACAPGLPSKRKDWRPASDRAPSVPRGEQEGQWEREGGEGS